MKLCYRDWKVAVQCSAHISNPFSSSANKITLGADSISALVLAGQLGLQDDQGVVMLAKITKHIGDTTTMINHQQRAMLMVAALI